MEQSILISISRRNYRDQCTTHSGSHQSGQTQVLQFPLCDGHSASPWFFVSALSRAIRLGIMPGITPVNVGVVIEDD